MAGATALAFVLLESAFVRSDFAFAVVASHSSTTTPLFYRLTAMWSSQEGSLLLWLFLLGSWSSLILFATRHRLRVLAPVAQAVLLGFGAFFGSLLVFSESPFTRAQVAVNEGLGRVLRAPPRLPESPVPPRAGPPQRGPRPDPLAARPGDDAPPADALQRLHAVRDPIRLRDRRAGDAPARRGVDPLHAPVHAR